MSRRTKAHHLFIASLAILSAASYSSAAILYWEPAGSGIPDGGAGTWDTTQPFWSTDAAGTSYVAWKNAGQNGTDIDSAQFNSYGSGVQSTLVNVATDVTVNSLTFNQLYTLGGTGTITFSGAGGGTLNLNQGSGGTIIINTNLAGSTGLARVGSTSRYLKLGGNNTYTGITYANLGRITVTSNNALGAGNNAVADGTVISPFSDSNSFGGYLTLDGSGGAITLNEYVEMGRTGHLVSTGADNNFNGTLKGATYNTMYVDVPDHSLIFNGDYQTGSTLTKTSGGKLIFSASSTASNISQLNVTGGTLLVNGAVTTNYLQTNLASTGGILGGTGKIATTNERPDGYFLIKDGVLAPGDVGVGGTLTFAGSDLRLQSDSILQWDLKATDSDPANDLVNVQGTAVNFGGGLTLDGTLRINALDGSLADGGVYRLFNYRTGGTDFVNNTLDIDLANSPIKQLLFCKSYHLS